MVEIIAGQKGKGKTKYLLEKANSAIKDAKGSIVYLDKSSKHMYELNNRVRLINVTDFGIKSYYFSGSRSGTDVSGQLFKGGMPGGTGHYGSHRSTDTDWTDL